MSNKQASSSKAFFANILTAKPLQVIKFGKTLRLAVKVFAMPTYQASVQFHHRLSSKINLFTFDWIDKGPQHSANFNDK